MAGIGECCAEELVFPGIRASILAVDDFVNVRERRRARESDLSLLLLSLSSDFLSFSCPSLRDVVDSRTSAATSSNTSNPYNNSKQQQQQQQQKTTVSLVTKTRSYAATTSVLTVR